MLHSTSAETRQHTVLGVNREYCIDRSFDPVDANRLGLSSICQEERESWRFQITKTASASSFRIRLAWTPQSIVFGRNLGFKPRETVLEVTLRKTMSSKQRRGCQQNLPTRDKQSNRPHLRMSPIASSFAVNFPQVLASFDQITIHIRPPFSPQTAR
jgi:hypothetical protein